MAKNHCGNCKHTAKQSWEDPCQKCVEAAHFVAWEAASAPAPMALKEHPDFIAGYNAGLADGKRCAERDAPAPVAHPLTDEQIDAIFRKTMHWIGASPKDGLFIKFARAVIEASAPAPVAQSCCDHASDCAVHNAPALPVGPCDCGVTTALVLTPAQAHADELLWSLKGAANYIDKLGGVSQSYRALVNMVEATGQEGKNHG
jgi:hypothetical protein